MQPKTLRACSVKHLCDNSSTTASQVSHESKLLQSSCARRVRTSNTRDGRQQNQSDWAEHNVSHRCAQQLCSTRPSSLPALFDWSFEEGTQCLCWSNQQQQQQRQPAVVAWTVHNGTEIGVLRVSSGSDERVQLGGSRAKSSTCCFHCGRSRRSTGECATGKFTARAV